AKLSPWFSERRKSTVEDIRRQLRYREENLGAVRAFHTTRSFGKGTKVLIDEAAQRFMVTSAKDLFAANPDVLELSQVTGCELDIQEHRRELRHADKDGKQVSFVPPRYEYYYDFFMDISVDHPFFDQIRFRLSPTSVEVGQRRIGEAGPRQMTPAGARGSLAQQVTGSVLSALSGGLGGATWSPAYNEYFSMGQEIKMALLQQRMPQQTPYQTAAEPKRAVTCPHCGATTIPDGMGCCEYCGGAL
ncbi:MAG: hypothetical protein IK095_08780, partial [Oscillospiraceae bacterium]|nr:hypothetical protein [Oscillospiraceae bacterium]